MYKIGENFHVPSYVKYDYHSADFYETQRTWQIFVKNSHTELHEIRQTQAEHFYSTKGR